MGQKRDKNGRFVKGGKGGPGRSTRAREAQYWKITKSTVSPDDWKSIITKAVELAKTGDNQARKFLLDILVGDPNKLRQRQDASDTPMSTVKSTADVVEILSQELAHVSQFENDTRRAQSVALLSDKLLKALEIDALAARLDAIERILMERGK